MHLTRRNLLRASAAGLALQPALASKSAALGSFTLHTLTALEYETVTELADVLVPGAEQAGVGLFLDHHLSVKLEQCSLMIRYLGVPSPFISFYQNGLENVQSYCEAEFNVSFTQLSRIQKEELVDAIAQDTIPQWKGFPASFFHFVLRADAADVVYGTVSGFERLGIPYAAHINPTSDW